MSRDETSKALVRHRGEKKVYDTKNRMKAQSQILEIYDDCLDCWSRAMTARSVYIEHHEGCLTLHSQIRDNSLLNELVLSISLSTVSNIASSLVQKPDEPIVVTLVNYTNSVVFSVVFEVLTQPVGSPLDEFVVHARIDEDVISSETDLTAVQILGENNALSGHVNVCGRCHDARRLATEFEHSRRQMLCCGGRDDFGNSWRASVEDMIKSTFQHHCRLFGSAGDNLDGFLVKVFRYQLGHQILAGDCSLRRLDHPTASRRNGRNQWAQSDDEGKVPGSQYKGHAQGFLPDACSTERLEQEASVWNLIGGPLVNVLQMCKYIILQGSNVSIVGFEVVTIEISVEGFSNGFLVVGD